MVKKKLDNIDAKIVALLQTDGRMPFTEISKNLSITEGAVRKRLKKLIDSQVIQIVAIGNLNNLGYGMTGFFIIHSDPKKIKQVINKLKKIKNTWFIATVTGGAGNIIAEFFVNSFSNYNKLLNQIHLVDGVEKIEKQIYTETFKEDYRWGAATGRGK